jgi:ribosome-associated heat shock protein Hsp15
VCPRRRRLLDGRFRSSCVIRAGSEPSLNVRLDKWLWAVRFFKTRALAQEAIERGQVMVADERVKVARPVRLGEQIWLRTGSQQRTVVVCGLSDQRGPAPVAQALYEETDESVRQRELHAQWRRLHAEPAQSILGGRPTKRDRRELERSAPQGFDGA